MEHFFIITNKPKDENLQITHSIIRFFEEQGKTCAYQCLEHLEEKNADDAGNPLHIDERTECILVIGGDGTLLQAARCTLNLDIPLLGINYGTLGFLAEVEKSNLNEALTALLSRELEIEKRMMLEGCILRGSGLHAPQADAGKLTEPNTPADTGEKGLRIAEAAAGEKGLPNAEAEAGQKEYALNDIVLTRPGTLRILNFDIYVNGQFLNHYSADGVIVSTPTGSTGYNMSAGGPIVEPRAELLLITPICPHTLNTRSIILSASDQVEVRIPIGKGGGPQEVEVNFDGNHKGLLHTGDSIQIGRSEKVTKFVRINQVSFLEVLHKKMSE
ncbi:MAG: NAD(+)/NADH kinase [Lachnospiraceae bacterium]|nr:NAD(+)/NADH kinase [Lachnospiraceae bacterium]